MDLVGKLTMEYLFYAKLYIQVDWVENVVHTFILLLMLALKTLYIIFKGQSFCDAESNCPQFR